MNDRPALTEAQIIDADNAARERPRINKAAEIEFMAGRYGLPITEIVRLSDRVYDAMLKKLRAVDAARRDGPLCSGRFRWSSALPNHAEEWLATLEDIREQHEGGDEKIMESESGLTQFESNLLATLRRLKVEL